LSALRLTRIRVALSSQVHSGRQTSLSRPSLFLENRYNSMTSSLKPEDKLTVPTRGLSFCSKTLTPADGLLIRAEGIRIFIGFFASRVAQTG
jgi:hypothetical protein